MLLTLALFCCLALMGFHFFKKVKGNNLGVKANRSIIQSFCWLLSVSLLLVNLVVYLITNTGMSYTNIQHTALRFSGISFKNQINYASVNHPQTSLSGLESGNIDIQSNGGNYILKYNSLSLPLMLTDSTGAHQVLANNLLPQAVSTGLTILSKQGDTLLQLNITNGKEYAFKYKGSQLHESSFKGEIQNQLPINQILKTSEPDNSQAYLDGSFKAAAMLEGARFIYSEAYKNLPAGLYLFPGENLQYEANNLFLLFNGTQQATRFNAVASQGSEPLNGGKQFYILQDATSRFNRLYCSAAADNGNLLLYTNPSRFALPPAAKNDTVHCQLTTSFDTILASSNRLFLQPVRLPIGNPFTTTAAISYVVEKGKKPLALQLAGVSGTLQIPGSQSTSYLLPTANGNNRWIITAQDFIQENGFSFWLHILLPSILFCLLCWLLLSLFWVDGSYASKSRDRSALVVLLYPYIKKLQPIAASARFNPVWCYMLWTVGVLLPFRYLLQWRMASFPPLQVQSVQGFTSLTHYFTDGSFWGEQLCVLLFFVALLAIAKNNQQSWWGKLTHKRIITAFWIAIGITIFTALFGLFVVPSLGNRGIVGLGKRFFTLCVPLFIFFILMQAWLYLRLSIQRNGWANKGKGFAGWCNNLIFKWTKAKNNWHWFFWMGFLVIAWFIALYKNEKSFLLLLMLSLIIWWLLSGFKRTKKTIMWGAYAGLIALVFFIVALPFFSSTKIGFTQLNAFDKAKQTLSRLQLLAEDRDSLLMNNPAYTLDDTLFTKLIETSKNQHIINNYQSYKAGWLNNGVWGVNIKPHHNYNSDYATQASDLAGLRYINAEYGWLCLVAVVLLLMAPLIARLLLVYDRNNDNTSLTFFGPGALIYQRDMFHLLVVAIVAIMVALSSSNLFVFMGLDLPVVGFNSKIALLFPLVAFGLFAASFSTDTEKISQPLVKRSEGSPAAKQVFAIASFSLLLTTALIAVNTGWFDNYQYKNKTAGTSYSLENFAQAVKEEMEQLSPILAEVQYELPQNGTSKLTDRMLMDAVLHKLDSIGENVSPLANFAIRHTHRICSNPSLWYNASDEFVQAEKASDNDSITGGVKEYFKFSVNTKPFNLTSPLVESDDLARPDILAPGEDSLQGILLAKAVNINGSFKYVFPQKSRFPLIYDLVNDMQQDTAKPTTNQPILLSIDLALHDTLQSILARNPAYTKGTIDQYLPLINFARLPYHKKISHNNGTGIYWDAHTLTFGGVNSGLTNNIIVPNVATKLRNLYASGQSYQINGWLTAVVSEHVDTLCTPVFVTALDANGSIHSIFAYNTGYGYDPNEISEYDAAAEKIRKYNTNELMIENNLRIHPCLQKLTHGPGSSLKPIVYDAMMSQVNIDWENIRIENNYGNYVEGIYLNQYAGLKLRTQRGGWPVNKPGGVFNEYGGPQQIRPADYMSYSSNLYHSAMLFLGGHTKKQLLAQKNTLGLDTASKKSPFPKILYTSKTLYFNNKPWPPFGDTASLLMGALYKQFGFTINGLLGKDKYYEQHASIYGPAPAVDQGPLNTQMDIFKTYIWTATSGGNPFHISPLQMAIMGTKMFTQDQSIHASYINKTLDTINKYQAFETDASYTGGFAQYKTKFDSLILKPLSEDIFTAGKTLYGLNALLLKGGVQNARPLQVPTSPNKTLTLYAKTGTANVANSRGVNESRSDKLLIGCLSEGSISGVQTSKPKLITFFIDHVEGAGKSEDFLRKEIVTAIATSQQTQNYFKQH